MGEGTTYRILFCLLALTIPFAADMQHVTAQNGTPVTIGDQSATRVNAVVQTDTSYSFLVAGHAYGAHAGENIGLHPPLLQSLDAGVDSLTAFIVLTGDIVNYSTPESWQQVETELARYPFPAYYVMGNHDSNETGRQVFVDKYGSTWYSFRRHRDLFVVLNSTEADRSISPVQLEFLETQIAQAGDTTRRIFIFFHEILWNSHEKYTGVRSNSRSRYASIAPYSNYWEEVHPLLDGDPERQYVVIGGDMGGNPDAMAAFYDRWGNVTLLASGMGEVADENYLLVRVHGEAPAEFELVPLRDGVHLYPLEYYSVPPAPDSIEGPGEVTPGSTGVVYSVPEVFNATSYVWELPEGLTGSSASVSIFANVDPGFTEGILSVKAERDGFGAGPPAMKSVQAKATSVGTGYADGSPGIEGTNPGIGAGNPAPVQFHREEGALIVKVNGQAGEEIHIRIFDSLGRLVRSEKRHAEGNSFELRIPEQVLPRGMILISISLGSEYFYRTIID